MHIFLPASPAYGGLYIDILTVIIGPCLKKIVSSLFE